LKGQLSQEKPRHLQEGLLGHEADQTVPGARKVQLGRDVPVAALAHTLHQSNDGPSSVAVVGCVELQGSGEGADWGRAGL
jgi:hypothetical protein